MKNLTAVWLLAVLLNVFSIAVHAVEESEVPPGMVYCPLTKQFQPIKSPKSRENKLYDFCASDERKREFTEGFLTSGQAQTGNIERQGFEKLVFDFFEKGREVFLGLPFTPELPNRQTFETLNTSLPAGNAEGFRANPATRTAEFSFEQNPRPPDAVVTLRLKNKPFISRDPAQKTAPRAPPVSV